MSTYTTPAQTRALEKLGLGLSIEPSSPESSGVTLVRPEFRGVYIARLKNAAGTVVYQEQAATPEAARTAVLAAAGIP